MLKYSMNVDFRIELEKQAWMTHEIHNPHDIGLDILRPLNPSNKFYLTKVFFLI